MAVFPENNRRNPQYGYDATPEENVKRTPPEAGNSYIRDSWGGLRFMARMEFLLNLDDYRVMWSFYQVNRLNGFTLFDFNEELCVGKEIGEATGAPQTFTLPAKETSGHVFYADGVLIPGSYNVAYGVGAEGEDVVTFSLGELAAGEVLSGDFSGRRKYVVEFAEKATNRRVSFNKMLLYMSVREKFPLASW